MLHIVAGSFPADPGCPARRLGGLATACAIGAIGVVVLFASSGAAADDRAPLWTAAPYRQGIEIAATAGTVFCVPHGQQPCVPTPAHAARPAFGLDVGLGYRVMPWLTLGGEYSLTTRISGLEDEHLDRTRRRGLLGTVQFWIPLPRDEVGFGGGLGMRTLNLHFDAESEFSSIEYQGLAVRPTIVYRHWVLADYALGVRVIGLFDTNAGLCLESQEGKRACPDNLGPVPIEYREVSYRGIMVGLEMVGIATLY